MNTKFSGAIGSLDYKHPKVKVLYWLFFVLMILVALVCFLPPFWLMLSSLKDVKEFFQMPPTLIPRTFNIEKIGYTWNLLHYGNLYKNTLVLAAGSLFFAVFFNGLLGYFLSKLKPRGSSYVFGLVLWTMLLPNTLNMVPIYKTIVKFPILEVSLMNTFWPIWMMAGANAFFVFIFKGFFDGIPNEIIEAARIDGCSRFGIFIKIIMPLSKPVFLAITILSIQGTWSDFFWPFMTLTDRNLWTVIVAVYNLAGTTPLDVQFVALSLAILPPVILFLIFQRYIMEGFTFSGVKG